MYEVKCNLCGSDDYTVRFPKGYAQVHRVVVCNKCGLMYANPQEIRDCETFQDESYPKTYDPANDASYFSKQHAQLPDNLEALQALDQIAPQRGRLLEIGSFCGIFLDQIRADGWETIGLEPNLGVANYSRDKYGLKIVDGVLPNPDIPTHSFDAVVMLHVIEHMPDPSANLREIHRLLKPGGMLVVETPRFDSLMFKLLGRRERSMSNCNGHIYFFTVPTLRAMLEKNGFEVVRTDLVGRTLFVNRLIYNIGVMCRNRRVVDVLSRIVRFLGLGRKKLYVNARDMQRIYARAV